MKYTVLSNLMRDGAEYLKGEFINLEEDAAKELVSLGVIEAVEKAAGETETTIEPVAPAAPEAPATDAPLPPAPAVTEPPVVVTPPAPVVPANGQPSPAEIAATLAATEASKTQPSTESAA